MVEIIQKLLFTHNCVIIPDFGAFVCNYAPAEIHLQENKIIPPYKTIAFNKTLKRNDGVLINAIAHYFQITYAEAETKLKVFVTELNVSLQNYNSIIFNNIGKITRDNENNIKFQPYIMTNYLQQSYGLPSLPIYPIQRLKDIANVQVDTAIPVLSNNTHNNVSSIKAWTKAMYGLVALLIISVITISWFINVKSNNNHQIETNLTPNFNIVSSPKNETEITPKPEINTQPISQTNPETQNKEMLQKQQPLTVSPVYTTIVVGAFFDELRAEKMKNETEQKGYQVIVSKDSINNIYRTTVITESPATDSIMDKIKTEINPRAWVYDVNNKNKH